MAWAATYSSSSSVSCFGIFALAPARAHASSSSSSLASSAEIIEPVSSLTLPSSYGCTLWAPGRRRRDSEAEVMTLRVDCCGNGIGGSYPGRGMRKLWRRRACEPRSYTHTDEKLTTPFY